MYLPSALVRPGFQGVYNQTHDTAPELLWRTSVNGFGVVMLSEWCTRDHRECIVSGALGTTGSV